MFLNDCLSGNACVDATYFRACAGENCCAQYCGLGAPCGDGSECISFFAPDPTPPGYEHVGICRQM